MVTKQITKQDIEEQNRLLLEKYGADKDKDELDISDQNIDALKYALYSIINNHGSLAGTTNLSRSQIITLAKLKGKNYFYNCKAIDIFRCEVMELQRSETKNPVSILESIGNLFKYPNMNQNQGFIQRFLKR